MRRLDLTGTRYGTLVATHYTRTNEKNKMAYWSCTCDCGSVKEYTLGNLRSGHTKSCGCASFYSGVDNANFLHGFRGDDKVYKAWNKIKERCTNPNDKSFHSYGAKGIIISDDLRYDFLAFKAEIGEPPSKSHSVDRINHKLGYIKGNLRWATDHQQAQNKGKQVNNSSGVTGVSFTYSGKLGQCTYAIATWSDNGPKNKKFNCKKLGLLPAFKAAYLYRIKIIAKLNANGAEYASNHGL